MLSELQQGLSKKHFLAEVLWLKESQTHKMLDTTLKLLRPYKFTLDSISAWFSCM
jgi:hypothetical protein